jgi:hypothetical protein
VKSGAVFASVENENVEQPRCAFIFGPIYGMSWVMNDEMKVGFVPDIVTF